MLDMAKKDGVKDEEDPPLKDRRLASIENGDLNWVGKGFLKIIKNDCENPNPAEDQKNRSK